MGLHVPYLYQFFYHDLEKDHTVDWDKLQKMQKDRVEEVKVYKGNKLHDLLGGSGISEEWKKKLRFAYRHKAPIINTDKAMAYLMTLVKNKGANMVTRRIAGKIQDAGEKLLKDFGADAILNATGLGAREVADDADVYPVRGAIRRVDNTRHSNFRLLNNAYLVPAQKDEHGHPTGVVFIVPRNDDILYVGSIIQPNTEEPEGLVASSPEVQIMWDRASDLTPCLQCSRFISEYPFVKGL